MSPKRKSSTYKWMKCGICESYIRSEDSEDHSRECPPSSESWNHRFLRNSILHSIVEVYNIKGKGYSKIKCKFLLG